MPGNFDDIDDSTPLSEIAASIGGDIFGGSPPESVTADPAPPPAASGNGDPAAPLAPAPAPPAPGRPLPKAWKKDMEPHWGALSPELHEYIYQREGDVSRGIEMYKKGHDQWNSLLSPHQALLQANPHINPSELLSSLLQSHLALSQGSPDERRQVAQALLQAYGVDLSGQPGQPDLASHLNPLRSEVQTLKQQLAQRDFQENLGKVETFFKDPANKYAERVQNQMLDLLKRDPSLGLKGAYEQAVWLNPEVRAELIAAQQAPAPAPHPASKLNVGSRDTPRTPAPRKGTIDDTIQSVVQKYL